MDKAVLTRLWSQYLAHDHSGGGRGLTLDGAVAAGHIAFWPGAASTIPAGWALCDGGGGRPDLRGRFLRGASADGDVGAIGGADTVDNSHAHVSSITTDVAGAHSHAVSFAATSGGSIIVNNAAEGFPDPVHGHADGATDTIGGVAHSITGNAATGGSTTLNNLPPHYHGYWIVKT